MSTQGSNFWELKFLLLHFSFLGYYFIGFLIIETRLKTWRFQQGFPNSSKEWGEILLGGGGGLPGDGNLRRSDFDDSNLFQS